MRTLSGIAITLALLAGSAAPAFAGLSSDGSSPPAPVQIQGEPARLDHEQAERQKAIDAEQRAKSPNTTAVPNPAAGRTPAQHSRGGRSCTSTHAECISMSMPFGPKWIGNCARLRNVCMQTGQWRSGLRNYSNVERR